MSDAEKQAVDVLLGKIETAIGQLPDRSGTNATLITTILNSVNGLRTICGVVRTH